MIPNGNGQSKYTDTLAREICLRLSDGTTLREVCRAKDIPVAAPTVHSWVVDNVEGFAAQYMRARATGYQMMADEIIEIIDDGRNDYVLKKNKHGEMIKAVDNECVARSKLRFQGRQWLLAKALPRIFGDRVEIDHSGSIEQTGEVTDARALARAVLGVLSTAQLQKLEPSDKAKAIN